MRKLPVLTVNKGSTPETEEEITKEREKEILMAERNSKSKVIPKTHQNLNVQKLHPFLINL